MFSRLSLTITRIADNTINYLNFTSWRYSYITKNPGLCALDIHCIYIKIHLVRKMLESKIFLLKNLTKSVRKPPKSSDLGGFLVAEAGLEPTTSGL